MKKPRPAPPTWPQVKATLDAARREGRDCPIEDWRALCSRCREWVSSIWVRSATSRMALCPKCARKDGEKVPNEVLRGLRVGWPESRA